MDRKKHRSRIQLSGHTPLTARIFAVKPLHVRLPTSPVYIRATIHSQAPPANLVDFSTGQRFTPDPATHPWANNLLPNWLNRTAVEQGGFVGNAQNRKTIYNVYGNEYNSGSFYPPGWFGFDKHGQPIEVSSLGSGALAKGAGAVVAEEHVLGKYPFADIPPNFAYNYYQPAHGGKPRGAPTIKPVFPDATKFPVKPPTKVPTHVIQ